MSNKVNISLTSKGQPTINLQIGDGAKKIIESEAAVPIISFVATGSKGEQGAPGTALLDDNSVTATQIADGTITSTQIQNFTISSNDIGAQQITSAKLGTNSVTTDKINADAVTSAKIADNSIGANHIVDGTIVKELITDLALTGDKIANGSISTIKLANDSVNASKIASKTITGAELADNLSLTGLTRVIRLTVDGQSPGYIDGPDNDLFYVRSNKDLIFVVDADQSSQADTSFFKFQNVSGTNLFTISETGEAVITGSLSVNGNITVTGTVDGIDINTALSVVQSNLTKISYLTVTQPVDLDAMETKLNGISDNEVIDWTTDQGSTNIHAGNYTDTNTTYSISCVDGDNSDEEKIRLTDSGGTNDDIVLEAGTGLSIARSGDKITFTNTVADTDTVLTAEQVQDIVGAMFTSNTETRIAVTYDDTDGTIDLVVDDMTADTNTQLTNEQVQDIVGAMVDGGTETNIAVTYDDTSGKLNFVSTDTNTTYSEATSSDAGLMSTAHHDKLDGIAAGAEVNVQSDWNSSSGDSQILNKPTIPVDLTSDGAGTIHANNVPTLNQDTTGTSAVATTARGLQSTVDGDIDITSDGHVTIKLDKDNDETFQRLKITNNVDAEVAYISEVGDFFIRGKITNTGSDANLNIESDGNMVFVLDRDNDETGQYFSFNNFVTEIARLDESGDLQIDGGLITGSSASVQTGTIELGHASDTTIARSAAGTVTIEGNTIATTNKVIDAKTVAYWSSSTSGFYITLSGASTSENTSLSTASYTLMYVAPYDGKIKRISSFHQNAASGTSTFEVYIDGDDSDLTNDQRGSDMTTSSFTTKFTEDCPADWTFSKGEAIAIKRTDSVARYGVTMTIVFEYDTTT